MQGLKITNHLRWSDAWSAELGRRLEVRDSTYDLLIFDPRHSREEIRSVLADVPEDTYRLFEVNPAATEECELWTDNGQCYQLSH